MAIRLRDGALLGGRYRLERVLGTGGMATVWLARDERLGRPVAAKILSDTLAADPTYLRRFRREVRLAAGLSHPNLVTVYDFGGEGERPYLAMEYVEGGSLADRISAGTARALDPSRLARELLGALDHIHGAGIVHRDIKPGNV
jgi:serine/threonine-protein kinase